MSYFAGSRNSGAEKIELDRFIIHGHTYEYAMTSTTGLWDVNSQAIQNNTTDGWPRATGLFFGRTGSGTYNEGDTFTIDVEGINRNIPGDLPGYGAFRHFDTTTTYGTDYTVTPSTANRLNTGFIPLQGTNTGNLISNADNYDRWSATFDISVITDFAVDSADPEEFDLTPTHFTSWDDIYAGTMFAGNFPTTGSTAIPDINFYKESSSYTWTNFINDTSQQAVSGTLNFSYYENRYGATIGTWEWYWCDTNGTNATLLATGSNANYGSATWLGPITIASGTTVTPNVGHVVCVYRTGTSFTGDLAFDDMTINGTLYSTFGDFGQWTAWADQTPQTSGGASGIATAFANDSACTITTSASPRGWNIDQGTTPSGSTGPSAARSNTYYIYAETSAPNYSNKYLYLISPQITA